MQESIDQMMPWFEWVRWKHHQLLDAKRHDLAISFMEDVLKVLRCPIAGLAVAAKKAADPVELGAVNRLRGTVEATHPIQAWMAANPDPFRETLEKMAALKERWGEKTGMPAEPG